jgi:endoglucanase
MNTKTKFNFDVKVYFALLTLLIMLLVTIFLSVFPILKAQNSENQSAIKLGIFDYKSPVSMETKNMFKMENRFRAWGDMDLLANDINEINETGREPLMTIEPWPLLNEAKGEEMFWNILTGKYDTTISTMCQNFKRANGEITLRWGHEMDMVGSRYFWATQDAELFIYAYRYVIKNCRKEFGDTQVKQARLKSLWSPAGRDTLRYYYPGSDVIDYTGFSMFSYPAYEQFSIGRKLVFEDLIYDRYPKLVQFNKPMIIAEFGIAGSWNEKNTIVNRIQDLSNLKQEFPLLETIVFFQEMGDSWVPGVVQAPDYRLTSDQFNKIR